MQSVDYFDAWALWWSGVSLNSMQMGEIPFIWWTRAGKLLQYAGGVVIVLDLIGPERLRKAGTRTQQLSRRIWGYNPISIVKYLTMRQDQQGRRSIRPWWIIQTFVHPGIIGFLFFYLLLPLLLASLLVLLTSVLVRGTSRVLLFGDRPSHPVRWFAFVILTIGFHLDLLGS